MAINVLRRPPVTLSRFAANARLRNVGAEVITPNEASAMPPDLMKYLLFIIVYLFLNPCLDTGLVPLVPQKPGGQVRLLNNLRHPTVFETPANQESNRQSSPRGCRSRLDSRWQAAVAARR